jgi:hypothetical protein
MTSRQLARRCQKMIKFVKYLWEFKTQVYKPQFCYLFVPRQSSEETSMLQLI